MAGKNVSQNKIYVDLVDRLVSQGGFKKIGEQMQRFDKQGRKTKNLAGSVAETFQKDMPAGMQEVTKVMSGTNAAGEAYVKTSTNIERKQQRFNMNALGVMFAGMALNRTMSTLNATSREWVGINELMSTVMGVVTLPATMDLLNFGVLPLFDALTNLPEGAKKAIGLVIIGLEGMGAVMMVGGQLMLGLESSTNMLRQFGDGSVVTGIGKITDKLKGLARYAAIGISLSMAAVDLAEGEITAAIGDVMLAAGFYWKNGWLLGAGILLKITGDADAQAFLAKTLLLLGDQLFRFGEWASDTLKKALTLRWDEIDTTFFSNFMDVYGEAGEKLNQEGKLHSDFMKFAFGGMGQSSENYKKKLEEIGDTYREDSPGWVSAVKDLEEEYETLIDFIDKTITRTTELNQAYQQADYSIGKMINEKFSFGGDESRLGQDLNPSKNKQISITATYNVNVSDKKEFEQMLKANNSKLTADIRRQSSI